MTSGVGYSDPVFATAEDFDALDAQLTTAWIAHDIVQPTDGAPAGALKPKR